MDCAPMVLVWLRRPPRGGRGLKLAGRRSYPDAPIVAPRVGGAD